MAKRLIIECIKDVIMKNPEGVRAFTKERRYRTYGYTMRDNYTIAPVICAKNDMNERHIIKYEKEETLDEFFNEHFKIVE